MIRLQATNKIRTFLISLLLVGQLAFSFTFLLTPKPAQAVLGIADLTFNTTTVDIPRAIYQVVSATLERIAVNYANKYLAKFIDQVSDKYRIKDFLFYDKYLSDYYVSNAILKNVSDPDLKRAYNIMLGITVTGTVQYQGTAGTVDPKAALIPALKNAMAQYYVNHGGVDPNKCYNPDKNVSTIDYFGACQAYFSNPESFTAQNIQQQFGSFQSSATTASQLEIAVGNSLKAGRIVGGTCQSLFAGGGGTVLTPAGPVTLPDPSTAKDPVACAKAGGQWQESALDQARSLITNPTSFIDSHISSAFQSIFKNNYDASGNNPFTQIGQLLGDYIFKQLNLNDAAGTFNEAGSAYNPNSSGSATIIRDVDLDGDGIPDGQDNDRDGKLNSQVDACYHGGTPPNCVPSGILPPGTSSPYFTPICQATDDAIYELTKFHDFLETHQDQESGTTDFKHEADAQIWGQNGSMVESRLGTLIDSIQNFNDPNFDKSLFIINRYNVWLDEVVTSLYKDNDVDLQSGFGSGGGGFYALRTNTANILDYIQQFRQKIGKCDFPNSAATANIPEPTLDVNDSPNGGGDTGTGALPPADALTKHPDRSNVVAQVKAQLEAQGVDLSGPCGAFEIVKGTAWQLRGEGAGLLSKPSGNNCNGYATDIIIYSDGYLYDILGDAGGANIPQWSPDGCGATPTCASRYVPAFQP